MRPLLVFLIAVLASSLLVDARPDMYTTKYDNIDIDEILNNNRLYKKYFDCLSNKGKCPPDGQDLKDAMPEALASGCKKCNEKQRNGSEKVLKFIIEKKPQDYKALEKLYDPQGIYRKKYQDEAKQRGIKLPD